MSDGSTENPLRLLLICSSGGHLAQLMTLEPFWGKHDRHWVTFNLPDSKARLAAENVTWAHHPTTRNLPNLARNFGLAKRILSGKRPDLIISTGAGVAVPFFVLGRALGIPTVYIEVYDRFDTLTTTARLCQPFTDVFCVQREDQLKLYRKARLIGPLL